VICGTRGNPDTVAPFRAWRGSRDLVAQSPKFHAPAAALSERRCWFEFSTPKFLSRYAGTCSAPKVDSDSRRDCCCQINLELCGCGRSVWGLHFGWIHPVHFERPSAVNLHDRFAFAEREVAHLFGH
jgi:hypothetical protein